MKWLNDLLEWIRNLFGIKGKCEVQKARKIKLTVRDLQENCVRIKAAMDKTPIGTDAYEKLQKELEAEQTILKKHRDANQIISLKDALVIVGASGALIFFIALAREYPTALKTASTILKFIPFKG